MTADSKKRKASKRIPFTVADEQSMATTCLRPGRYTMSIRDEWAYVYEGRRRVFSCNETFARVHFLGEEWP